MRIWGKYWGYLRGMGGKITYYTVGWDPLSAIGGTPLILWGERRTECKAN